MKIKKIVSIIIAVILFTACSPSAKVETSTPSASPQTALHVGSADNLTEEIRGVWIASVYNINFPSAPDLEEDKLKAEIDSIIESVDSLGLNTIFFQAHPSADALYKSEIFPVSKFISSTGELYFDPLEYIIQKSHEKDIRLHVWINPLRVTTSNASSREEAIESLSNDPLTTSPEMLVYYDDGKLYYNAGLPTVRQLITNCVAEIISKYDVDGVVFDDFFYPYPVDGAKFDDSEAYDQYSEGKALDDWRRNNINELIKNVYDKIKEIDESCLFGVSPFGIWQNSDGTNGGSDTSGLEAYSAIYCDALTWAEGGYVDYLSPQLYWSTESEAASFEVLCNWWNTKLDGTDCAFIPSLAPYRYDNDWTDPHGEMSAQVTMARDMITYRGVLYYGFATVDNNVLDVGDEIKSASNTKYYFFDANQSDILTVQSHKTGYVSQSENITLVGTSDPAQSLTMNGEKVSRTTSGDFEIEVTLVSEENTFDFQNGKNHIEVKVYLDHE